MSEIRVFLCETREKGEALLAGAAQAYGLPALPLVARTPRGKPYFPELPEVCFSVSHSGALWCAAFYGAPVGVDVQQHRACPMERIARRFFHPEEAAYVAEHGQTAFFNVWTAKESHVKCTGRGIDEAFSRFSVVRGGALSGRAGEGYYAHAAARPGYSLCVCAGEAAAVRVAWL